MEQASAGIKTRSLHAQLETSSNYRTRKYNVEYENRSPSISPLRKRISSSPSPTRSSYRQNYSRSQYSSAVGSKSTSISTSNETNKQSYANELENAPQAPSISSSSGGTNAVSVKDFAKKLNSQVQKKSNFRPSWVKQASSSSTTAASPSRHRPRDMRKNESLGSALQPKQNECILNKQSTEMENSQQVENSEMQKSPINASHQPVLQKAHYWRVQASISQSKALTFEKNKKLKEGGSPRDSKKSNSSHQQRYAKAVDAMQKRQSSRSPVTRRKFSSLGDHATATVTAEVQRQAEQVTIHPVTPIKDDNCSSIPILKESTSDNGDSTSPIKPQGVKALGQMFSGGIPTVSPETMVFRQRSKLTSMRRNEEKKVETVKKNVNTAIRPAKMDSDSNQRESEMNHGKRIGHGAVASDTMRTEQDHYRDDSKTSQDRGDEKRVSETFHTAGSFQSKIAQFSGNSKSTPIFPVSSRTMNGHKNRVLLSSHARRHSDEQGKDDAADKCVQADDSTNDKNEHDLNGIVKEKEHMPSLSSRSGKSREKEDDGKNVDAKESSAVTSEPKSMNGEVEATNASPESAVSRSSNQIRSNLFIQKKHKVVSGNSPKQKDNVGAVSQKAQFWTDQQQKSKNIQSRGRHMGGQSSKLSSLSQQNEAVQRALSNSSSPSSSTKSTVKGNPSSPASPGQKITGFLSEIESANGSQFIQDSSDDVKNEYMQYINRNKSDRRGLASKFISYEDSVDMDEQEQENFRLSLKKSDIFSGRKHVTRSLESNAEVAACKIKEDEQNLVSQAEQHSTTDNISSAATALHDQAASETRGESAAVDHFGSSEKKKQTLRQVQTQAGKEAFRSRSLSSKSVNRDEGRLFQKPSSRTVANDKCSNNESERMDEITKIKKFPWPPVKEITDDSGCIADPVRNSQNERTQIKVLRGTMHGTSPVHETSYISRPFDEVSTPSRNPPKNATPMSPEHITPATKMVQSPPKCNRTSSVVANDVPTKSSVIRTKFNSQPLVLNEAVGVTCNSEVPGQKVGKQMQKLYGGFTPKSLDSSFAKKDSGLSKGSVTPRSIATTVTATDDGQLELAECASPEGNMVSEVSPISPVVEESDHVPECETHTVNTDTSSFLPVSEVKKRLWDDGEKLKWQKDNALQHRKSLFQSDKDASLFKSRYYHAAEVAQKHCMENKNSIPIPSGYQTSPQHYAPKQQQPQSRSEEDIEKLVAKLSSIKRDDPDAALRAIDSILEKHDRNEKKLDCAEGSTSVNGEELDDTPILPPEYFEESSLECDEDASSMCSDSDDSTVSSITNPTYMSGFGEPALRQYRKQQFGKLLSKDSRLQPPSQSTRPSSFLVREHPYSQRRSSELPPLQPRKHQEVTRKVKALADANTIGKPRIRRKSSLSRNPVPHPNSNLHADDHSNLLSSGTISNSQNSDFETRITDFKPPAKSLSAGGSSSTNQGLLSKLKDIGSDSDDKDDEIVQNVEKSPKSPRSPSQRLKRLAKVATKVRDNGETQHHLLDRSRRFLYPKRDASVEKEKRHDTVTDLPFQSKTIDPAWLPSDDMATFNEDFFHNIKQNNNDGAKESFSDECHAFDPFGGTALNDSFANEVLAEKFSRMERAYQNL